MTDREKVVDNLTDLKEMLKWQKDIKGESISIGDDILNDEKETLVYIIISAIAVINVLLFLIIIASICGLYG